MSNPQAVPKATQTKVTHLLKWLGESEKLRPFLSAIFKHRTDAEIRDLCKEARFISKVCATSRKDTRKPRTLGGIFIRLCTIPRQMRSEVLWETLEYDASNTECDIPISQARMDEIRKGQTNDEPRI